MLITKTVENNQERIYVTRFASVVTYFTRDERDPDRATLCIEPGLFAYPETFAQAADHVRTDILDFVAGKLGIAAQQVLTLPFAALLSICEPELPDFYRYARSKNRAYPRAFR